MKKLKITLLLFINCANLYAQNAEEMSDSAWAAYLDEFSVIDSYHRLTKDSSWLGTVDTLIANKLEINENYEKIETLNKNHRIIFIHDDNLLVIESLDNLSKKFYFLNFDNENGYTTKNGKYFQCDYLNKNNENVTLKYTLENDGNKKMGALVISPPSFTPGNIQLTYFFY